MKGIGNKTLALALLPILFFSMLPALFLAQTAQAASVTTPGVLQYNVPNGAAVAARLAKNPEFLKVHTLTPIHHATWIDVLGTDAYGQNIEAKALIPVSNLVEQNYPLVDPTSGLPVAFASITNVYQVGGEQDTSFQIQTMPISYEQFLGMYHQNVGYTPNIVNGNAVEPFNPDPLKVAVNWANVSGTSGPDLGGVPYPQDFTNLPTAQSNITIIGLDEHGNQITQMVTINPGAEIVLLDPTRSLDTWSTVCTVSGGDAYTSYYIFTSPEPQQPILNYNITISQIELLFSQADILANGKCNTTVTLMLLDQDGNAVHWAVNVPGQQSAPPIEVNFASSGGNIVPSTGIQIQGCYTNTTTTLTADTNARIVKVSAIAYLPAVQRLVNNVWITITYGRSLSWATTCCFDGINSAPTTITGYPYRATVVPIDFPSATAVNTCGQEYAAFITLYKGCNFISIPLVPDQHLTWNMIPDANQDLSCVQTYVCDPSPSVWLHYNFTSGVGDTIPICDGMGYWISAKENCTLVISGTFMAACQTPPEYVMCLGWNMVGVTSLDPSTTMNYLGSLDIQQALKLYGPVWAWRVDHWCMNPTMVYPGEALWVFSYSGILAP